jgi:hypothetical protein
MLVSDEYVSACIDAGKGNIGQGNQNQDDFLKNLPLIGGLRGGYTTLGGQSFTQSGSSGTFSINPSLWSNWEDLFIGFKFGTGNQPDEWFVYQLVDGVSTGTWSFVNVFGRGGGLSHVTLYGIGSRNGGGDGGVVSAPGTLALVGLGLFAAGAIRRKRAA